MGWSVPLRPRSTRAQAPQGDGRSTNSLSRRSSNMSKHLALLALALLIPACGTNAPGTESVAQSRAALTQCTNKNQCNDGNSCTTDTCDTSTSTPGVCVNTPIPGCCATQTDC